eukprot:2986691-Prymnesium_polylepis.1
MPPVAPPKPASLPGGWGDRSSTSAAASFGDHSWSGGAVVSGTAPAAAAGGPRAGEAAGGAIAGFEPSA